MPTQLDLRQSVLRSALPMVGSSAGAAADTLFPLIDAELAKLFEDRNIMLQNGGIVTFTGTQIQFTENLELVLNQKISGAAPQVISLGQATVTLANNEMWYAVIDRTATTAVMAVATSLPAVIAANQEVFFIAKRVDAGDGTQRVYWRNGTAMNAGQSIRIGASGSGGSGSGVGDDLGTLLYRASFRDNFDEGPSDSKSAVDITAGKTDANTFSAAKAMYVLNYDASKTVAAGSTTTALNMSSAPTFTVKVGDVAICAGVARRITAVSSQTAYTTDAFPSAPTVGAQVTISQAVHTKDIYNLPVDGNAISSAFTGETFSDILVDYEDTTASGDNIFDINTAPVIGFDASVDGTAFTAVQLRQTLEMTQMQSTTLPASGTALYMRFFANKTTGSGTVNVLGYRAFMQKSVVATAGGITNSAYGFTNGVGTPINATFSVVGGKTVITLGWQYAVGVYPNTTASSIEVWLNGQKLPRFVSATLTPDGSFLETANNIITLDRDYSSFNLSVEIFQRTQIVDASTQNTTAIASQQEIMQNGFQSFVASNLTLQPTTAVGTPAVGTFYSTISNRAAMTDITQDLRANMGIDPMSAGSIYQINTEFGPNGEPVYGLANDLLNRVRFVGTWYSITNTYGSYIETATVNDYVEVTFYGTGLNILCQLNNGSRGVVASVDGGANSSNLVVGNSNVLGQRNYAMNSTLNVASNLALGVHTVKVSLTAIGLQIHGFQVLNTTSTLLVNPGVSYLAGKKLVTASQSSTSYNSGFETGSLGTRGGRVLVYQKADGSIAKAAQSAGSQLNLASTDHTLEEVVRVYNFREFGAGRTDDFSAQTISGSTLAFTLDDGSTSLVGSAVTLVSYGAPMIAPGGAGSYISITFTGTGLDVVRGDAGNIIDPHSAMVDGQTVGSLTALGLTATPRIMKVVSGLPYGTHTVRITRTSGSTNAIGFSQFIVYQPKKPTLPSGCVELADYNVMANYVAFTPTNPVEDISNGVLRKFASREMVYAGTWALTGPVSATIGGQRLNSSTSGAYFQYTFLGSGFEIRGAADTTYSGNTTMTIDGLNATLANYPGLVVSPSGGFSLNTSTAVMAFNTTNASGSRLSVTGLPYGLHTVRVTANSVAAMSIESFDVITPIHSAKLNTGYDQQNTMNIGSNGISDNRMFTPVKDIGSQSKNVSQAIAMSNGPTTSSTGFVPAPDMSVTHFSKTGKIRIEYSATVANNTVNATTFTALYVNGIQKNIRAFSVAVSNQLGTVGEIVVENVPLGQNKIDVFWSVSSGLGTLYSLSRTLTVEEA